MFSKNFARMVLASDRMEATLVAVDTGGTFTDFYAISTRGVRLHKVASAPQDPSLALIRGLRELGLEGPIVLVHGSTVATNALLESKGARVALLTTAGFEDVLEIGRQNRPALYDLKVSRPKPLVERSRRIGIQERISSQGDVIAPLKSAAIAAALRWLRKAKPESVAICLLGSFANPKHERRLAAALGDIWPLSISSEISPEFREFERSSTTAVNAYVMPLMEKYLHHLKRALPHPIRIMQSNGGALSVEEASREAVRTLLSGPAGGALGAFRAGCLAGFDKLITLDMGGTSTDLSLMDGALELSSEAVLAGHPIKTPMLKIDTIGAGGGSIAWVDSGGALRVGLNPPVPCPVQSPTGAAASASRSAMRIFIWVAWRKIFFSAARCACTAQASPDL